MLINPNGIAITPTGAVNAGSGFVATSLGISDDDFKAGKRAFAANGASGAVTNAGSITVGSGGYAALIGGTVDNAGTISVPLGKIGLGSGEQATLDFSGDGFLQVAVPTDAAGDKALVDVSGTLEAAGGKIEIRAAAAREAARQAVNMSGVVEARTVSGTNGNITLDGGAGSVKVTGKVKATSDQSKGGKVTVTGRSIELAGAKVDVSGKTGGGSVKIGGDWKGKRPLARAETTKIDAATTIAANATGAGNGGEVVIWSDLNTAFAGTITATGGAQGGNGGEAEVSSHGLLGYAGMTVLTAPLGNTGTLLLDPYNVTISNATGISGFTANANDSVINVATLQQALVGANVTISTNGDGTQAGDITVAAPVTWSVNTLPLQAFCSIIINANLTTTDKAGLELQTGSGGDYSFGNGASATFNGSGQSLTINGQSYTLLYSMADVDGIDDYDAVTNTSTSGSSGNTSGYYALASDLDAQGTIYSNALVGIDNDNRFTGTFTGLGHTISNLTINKTGDFAELFGFVGKGGVIRNIGFVGGAVSGSDVVGGLVGDNFTFGGAGTITQSYATGAVSGSGEVGRLVGRNGGKITQSYFDTETSGKTVGVGEGPGGQGVTGLTTAQLQGSLPGGFDASVWGTGNGLYPYLKSFYPNGVQAVPGNRFVYATSAPVVVPNAGAPVVGSNAGDAPDLPVLAASTIFGWTFNPALWIIGPSEAMGFGNEATIGSLGLADSPFALPGAPTRATQICFAARQCITAEIAP